VNLAQNVRKTFGAVASARPAIMRQLQAQARFAAMLPYEARVLDLGCGDFTRIDRYLGRRRPDLEIVGVEKFDGASIYGSLEASGPARRRPYRRVATDIESSPLPFDDASFDAVYFSHVIEHLSNKPYVLSEIARVLKPRGLLYVETPGPAALRAGRPPWVPQNLGGTIRYRDDPTHLGAPFRLTSLQSLLVRNRFSVHESGIVRELGIVGMPLYAAMALIALVPFVPFGSRSFLYGAGVRNLTGWAIYSIAMK